MIECRHCRQVFRTPPEKVGARCPTCRMPLFEKERQRPPAVDLGPCAEHAEATAVAKCQRCARMMCSVCRTRWAEELLCPACLGRALADGEANPRAVQTQNRQAVWSLLLALAAWGLLLLTLWPLSNLFRGQPDKGIATFAVSLFLLSFLPALFALGHGTACIRTRGQRLALATLGVCLAGSHLGVSLGTLFLNVWHNF